MDTITVYSKEKCPFCIKTNNLLQEKGLDFKEIKLERDLPRTEFLNTLTTLIGKAPEKVPQIFINEQHIGGFTELAAHYGIDPNSVSATPA